ncbi:MAG TPA: alpha/beta fold hydrolase, partial [Longimicrobium sp.]|nr:alpha/beta fold hydrolase [Longimicrobium sp.]
VGRSDFQVKVRGFRIELGEIDARLREHDAVREAVVLAREDASGDTRLVAYYAGSVEAEALKAHLGALLPEYMVPATYVRLDAFPLTPNGKTDRRALPEPGLDAFASSAFEAPAGATEEALAGIWSEVLGVERVGRHDGFFALGGHSLRAMQLVSRVREVLGAEMALADVFAHPTVAALAARLLGAVPEGPGDRAIAVRAAGSQPPLFVVHEGTGTTAYAQLLHPHIDPRIPVYALPAAPEPGPRTVEGMAARLVGMIREIQPAGPYHLAGWSFGGLLAYEVAAQLIGDDETVDFVGMMDTHYRPPARGDDRRRDFALVLRILRMGAASGPIDGEEALLAGDVDLDTFVRDSRASGALPGHVTVERARELYEHLRAHSRAMREYYPRPLPIPVHLFPAAGSPNRDPRRGWQAVLPEASLRVTPVPGTHLSMMDGENGRALGEALSREIGRAPAKAPPGEEYSPLVTLRFGRGGAAPLFCVPGAGASVGSFADLMEHVDPSWPIHGLQPRGLDGDGVPHTSVRAAAGAWLRRVAEVQPTGPVHLLGHSFGGWIVFEMAQRLRRAGRVVGSLTILDSEVPDDDGALAREYDDREAFLKLVEITEMGAGRPLDIAAGEADALDETGRLTLLHDRMVRAGMMPRRSDHRVLRGPFRAFATCLRTLYTPDEPYPDPLRLVLVSDPRYGEEENQRQLALAVRGWRRWAPSLVFTRGEGNHITALKSPHVRALASFLAADRARG